ncbi:MAG TPA: aldo/keto reductase [Bryobacteraceae bacterium]|nr:aldo/keto reductase [Bryobacteraceae bacterium]
MERREFLKSALAGSVAAGIARGSTKPVPKRRYRDDVELSVIGFGGIVVCSQSQADADREVARSFERGINYFDVAPSYFDGEAEIKLGNALRPYRKKVFLACKTTERDAAGARQELERSLERLHTDHFDLYQFHAVTTMEDVEKILGPGGAAETFLKAKQEGKVKYLGCSAHSEEAALAMIDRFHLDSILFPINFVAMTQSNFGPRVIARAKEKGTARLALKALALTPWQGKDDPGRSAHPKAWYKPVEERELVEKALRFTLSEDITAAIPPGDEKIYEMALELAPEFRPLSASEREALVARARSLKPLFPIAG